MAAVFFVAAFRALAFLVALFLAAAFVAAVFLGVDLLAPAFLAVAFFVAVFLDVFGDRLPRVLLATGFPRVFPLVPEAARLRVCAARLCGR